MKRLVALLALSTVGTFNIAAAQSGAKNDYPTAGRVEYVQECINANGGEFSLIYKCSCVIDKMAEKYAYDDFVEGQTYSHYATLGGERGGVFREPPQAKEQTKAFRAAQAEAYKSCAMPVKGAAGAK